MRLFVADDHPIILESLKGVFHHFDAAAEVCGFTTILALEAALEHPPAPDLVLIDFNMPGLATVQAVAGFIARHPTIRVAVISGHLNAHLAQDLLRHGCQGFISKSQAPNVVYHAIRLMADGTQFVPDFLADTFSSAPQPNAPLPLPIATASPNRHRLGLTQRESEVLRCLALGHTNKQIGQRLSIEEVTVKLHLRRSYTKLGVRNRIETIQAVLSGVLDEF